MVALVTRPLVYERDKLSTIGNASRCNLSPLDRFRHDYAFRASRDTHYILARQLAAVQQA